MAASAPENPPGRDVLLLVLVGIALVITAIFWAISGQLTGPLVGPYLHLIPLPLALVGLGLFVGLRRLRLIYRILIFFACGLAAVWVDGLLLIVNQVADSGRAEVRAAKLRSADHRTISTGRGTRPFQATLDLVVELPGALGGEKNLGRMHLKGFHPVGSTLWLSIRPGALGFSWVDRAETSPP